jgi:hypothetical protein
MDMAAHSHIRRIGLPSLFWAYLLCAATAGAATPAPPRCDDATFLRRATLDLIGRQPTAKELDTFVASRSPSKRADLVDKLLADPAWATNWARYFRDVILYRRTEERAIFMAGPLEAFVSAKLAQPEAHWDEIAREMITARGSPLDHGETAIIMAQMGETADIAAEVSRVFTGIQIQCAQCHDHFTDRWKRNQFHELAAFFPRIEIDRQPGDGPSRFEVVSRDVDKRGMAKKPANPRRGELEHRMPDLDDPSKPGTVMQPRFFLTGHTLPLGTPDKERRKTVARLLTSTENPWFARAIVNRIWTELVGDGFYDGIDDLGPDREPRDPEQLASLCKTFVASDHDLKTLFRVVMGTPAYQSPSQSRSNPSRAIGETSCPQRLRADQLFSQVMVALGIDETSLAARAGKKGGEMKKAFGTPRAGFNQVFGYDPGLPRDEITGSIPQALMLMNGPQLATAIDADRPTLLGKLLRSEPDDRAVADELHVRTLGRHATPAEIAVCIDHVRATGDRAEAFEDVFWALINSAEFITRK